MKTAVVGAGAMGSVYATLFAEAGHDVWAIDQWAEHVDAINRDGLTLTGFTGDRTVTMSASTSVADAGTCDMYVIATKAAGAGAAAKSIAPFVATDTNVVTIQNGLGAAARITEHIASEASIFHSTTLWLMSTRSWPSCLAPSRRCCKITRTGDAPNSMRSTARWWCKDARRESQPRTTMRFATR